MGFVLTNTTLRGSPALSAPTNIARVKKKKKLSLRRLTLHGVDFFDVKIAKTNLLAKPFVAISQGLRRVRFMNKNCKKSCDTASLNTLCTVFL